MGGEYTSNNTLALEMVPKDRRGFVGGLVQGAFPLGFLMTTVVTTIMLTITTKEQYFAWGWRIPFVIGFLISFAFLLYYVTVPESPLWQSAEKHTAPLKAVLSGRHLRTLGQIFLMMTGFWLVGQPSTLLPSLMIRQLHVPSALTSNTFLFASIGLFFAFVGYGLLSQMIGRRPAILIASCVVLVLAPALYYSLVANAVSGGSPMVTATLAASSISWRFRHGALLPSISASVSRHTFAPAGTASVTASRWRSRRSPGSTCCGSHTSCRISIRRSCCWDWPAF